MTKAEMEAVEAIALGQDPTKPACEGPVVVHADGSCECHGGCKGVMEAFHDADVLEPCPASVPAVRHFCQRCQGRLPLDLNQ